MPQIPVQWSEAAGTAEPAWSEETEGLCPECLRSVPARLYAAAGSIQIERTCPRHGHSVALLASDAGQYLRLRQYVAPRVSSGLTGACCCGPGEECGTGPPVCVLLLEITLACNLRCPTCYADAHGHDFMALDEVRARLDRFFAVHTALDVLMLSGGEPTIHPELPRILELVLQYPVQRVLINTNGLRLRQGAGLVDLLASHRDRVELYFSFASFRAEAHERFYGRDLRAEKAEALGKARDARIFVTLVPTIEQGINDAEIGELYRYALSLDNVNGISYQPVMTAGRFEHGYKSGQRMTLTGVLSALEIQTEGELRATDFVGLPCSHPDCCALTYGFLDASRSHLTPVTRHLDVARYMELFADRISFSGMLGAIARRVWSDMAHLRARRTLRDLAVLFSQAGLREALPLVGDREAFGRRVFRVVVKPFMDASTYDSRRIAQCCTKILTETGEPVSFCEYNVLHRSRTGRTVIPLQDITRR